MMNLSRLKLLLELKARGTERPSFKAMMADEISLPERMAKVVPGAQQVILGKVWGPVCRSRHNPVNAEFQEFTRAVQ